MNVRNQKNSRISQNQQTKTKTKKRMASLTTDLGNNDIDIVIDFQDIDIYASKKAAKYGMKGKFTGKDSKGKKIEPSGSGKNEGKYTLKDVRKCLKVQEWIKNQEEEDSKELKKVNDFSSKSAKEAFDELVFH